MSRAEFLKQSLVVAAGIAAATPVVNAAVVEPEPAVDYGRNPAAFIGKGPNAGKAKTGQIKTGNAGSIMKH